MLLSRHSIHPCTFGEGKHPTSFEVVQGVASAQFIELLALHLTTMLTPSGDVGRSTSEK